MMEWIVLGEKDGDKIELVSKNGTGILPKGSFLTVESEGKRFILRVDDSKQAEPYTPSPLIAEMDLPEFEADRKCINKIIAYRIKDENEREDGLVDFIPPRAIAHLSSQQDVENALEIGNNGPRIFISTIHSNQNRILRDQYGKRISVCIPEDVFFHQMMICGKTGSGKTVAMKYLVHYFVETYGGSVLAVNVKDVDFLQMDKASDNLTEDVIDEWNDLSISANGLNGATIYMPANRRNIPRSVNEDLVEKITLDANEIRPIALTGLLQGVTDKAALVLPGIFNHWRELQTPKGKATFKGFIKYFTDRNESRSFATLSERGDESTITVHPSTYESIARALVAASDFFDSDDAKTIDETDILQRAKTSILDFSGENGPRFGAILLRDLLRKIVDCKDRMESDVPILIIIDEVHMFYGESAASEALDDLDTICRTGRSKKVGVIFASQNPSDIPKGLSSVINTKIFFKTDASSVKDVGTKISSDELEGLKKGYAVAQIHGIPQLRYIKFPLSPCGVMKNDD